MAPGIGPAAGLAYFYNLERFKFDAEQRQDCIHQMQNMRLAQWGLFREDVRDVFQLSTSNMDNYILVGALIVTAVMNFIFVGYPEFPLEPRWLLVLWNNCVFACIFFGLVSVWLAMHGSIAQRSAKVKILTQAVRPPVPSLKDIESAMRSQERFESDGAGRYFQPPAFAIPFALAEKDEIPKSEPSSVDPGVRTLPTGSGVSQRKGRARPKSQKEEPVDWLSDAPFAGEEVLQHLQTVDNGGPGRSAVMHSHFWMLRRVQRGYACFDAYARIGLVLAAQHMLLVCAYYSLGHFMSKMDNWPIPAQNPGAAWLSLIAGAFCTTTLFKLDLFCGPKYRNLVQLCLVIPPALSGLAIHLAASRTNHGRGGVRACDQVVPAWAPWALAILACGGHMLWMWVILRVSAPRLESSGLPLSFRSTVYLDVFGWHSRHFSAAAVRTAVDCAHWENPEKMLYEIAERRPDHKCLVATHREAKHLVSVLSQLVTAEMSAHLSQEESEDLQQLRFTLDEHLRDLETQMAMPAHAGRQSDGWERRGQEAVPAWLQSSFLEGDNEEVYWIDCRSGQVVWSVPEAGQIIDLFRLSTSLEELQLRIDQSPRSSQEPILAAEALPFELMPENPDVEVSSSLLPWKCVRLSCLAQMGVWLATIAVLLFDPKYYDSARAPREMYDSIALQVVQTDWPHDFFRPSALACSASGRHLMLGDQFAIFKAELELLGEHSDESAVERMEEEASRNHTHERISLKTITLEMAVPTTEIDFAFKSFGFLPGKNKLLLLNQGGTEITEYSLHGHRYVKTWKLSPTLPHKRLETIQPVEGQETLQCARDGSGFMNAGWLVYAATDSGQVVTLCPTHRNELHPLHMVISLRSRRPSQEVVEVVDSHTGTTKASAQTVIGVYHDPSTGYIWLLNTNTEGMAEVVVFDSERPKGGPLNRWPLPSGRWWVPGICNLGGGQGFLIAAAADTDRAGQVGGPELWRLVPRPRDLKI